jgi:hypothetical protein
VKRALVLILAVSALGIFVLNIPPLSEIEVPLQGGNAFIPRWYGVGAFLTLDAFALGIAAWVTPAMLRYRRLARSSRDGENVFMAQRTPALKRTLKAISPPMFIPVVASDRLIRFHGVRRHFDLVTRDVIDAKVNPQGFSGNTPTIELKFRRDGEIQETDFVVARKGFEVIPEKRRSELATVRRIFSRSDQ